MRYIFDNDMHIHSEISSCSGDPEQTNERILRYAAENKLRTICLTDHFWDDAVNGASNWYKDQNYEHIASAKPLPQREGIQFLFGCETELNKDMVLGISKEKMDLFDFIIIPTTHFHMKGYTITEEEADSVKGRVNAWLKRFDAVLNMDLPFKKTGLAHLSCSLISPGRDEYLKVLSTIPENEMLRLFKRAAELGVGIEINLSDMKFSNEEADTVLKMYRAAKECKCKFYCGSDAHHPHNFNEAKKYFERAFELLNLKEDDKFLLLK